VHSDGLLTGPPGRRAGVPDDLTPPVAGAPSDNTTMVNVLEGFRERGFEADFFVTPDSTVRCGACRHEVTPPDLNLDGMRRVEGASDPSDMAAVLGLICPACGARGTAVVRFGPEAGPEEDDVLRALDDHRFS
jgi:hypothetical protein